MRRAVVDSTVLISSFLKSGGVSAEIVDLAGEGFLLVLCQEIIDETRRKLLTGRHIRRYAAYPDQLAHEYCLGLVEAALMVSDLPPLSGVCRDPNDDVVLACAVAGAADCIVTPDQDLLSLHSYDGIDILPPEQFRQDLRAELNAPRATDYSGP